MDQPNGGGRPLRASRLFPSRVPRWRAGWLVAHGMIMSAVGGFGLVYQFQEWLLRQEMARHGGGWPVTAGQGAGSRLVYFREVAEAATWAVVGLAGLGIVAASIVAYLRRGSMAWSPGSHAAETRFRHLLFWEVVSILIVMALCGVEHCGLVWLWGPFAIAFALNLVVLIL